MKQDQAEAIALQALTWILSNEELGPVFQGSSGLDIAELKSRLDQPEVMLAVLDFLMMDDAWVIAFCDAAGQPYSAPATARQALPGGQDMNWT